MRGILAKIKSAKRERDLGFSPKSLYLMVPGAGIEPAHRLAARDFKSLASTISATRAFWVKRSDT